MGEVFEELRPRKSEVLVVGAGMAGLTAATTLADRGVTATVVDKARVVGGRMASRRLWGGRFDTGAQHFSVRSPEFRRVVSRWCEAGVVREWYRGRSVTEPTRGEEPRWIGSPAMRAIPEFMSAGKGVRLSTAVAQLVADADGIRAVDEWGEVVVAAATVILTPPLPQTLALLERSGVTLSDAEMQRLRGVRYDPCLVVMAALDGPSGLDRGHRALDGPVGWLADNQHKGTSDTSAVTIHSTAEFARARLEDDPRAWTEELASVAQEHLASTVTQARGHRWRYAQPRDALHLGAMALQSEPRVVLAGEAFAGARVEGAFLSGLAAVRALPDSPSTSAR